MSRRSLRINDSLLDRSLPHSSTSFSVGGEGGGWRSSRSLKPRRSQQLSVSCSESLLVHTPRKPSSPLIHNSSLHSVASDASLLSSLLDESSIQETTMVDTLWGLDHDNDPKDSTIIAEQSTLVADRTLTSSDVHCPKHPVPMLTKAYCKDCEPVSTYCSSSKYTSSSSSLFTGPEPSEHGGPETSTIYCRDRGHKSRTDALWLDSSVLCVRRAAGCCVSALTHTWQLCRGLALKVRQVNIQTDKHGAQVRRGVMNLKESTNNLKELHVNGSLFKHTPAPLTPPGDDCKEKQRSDTVASSSSSVWSSVASSVLGLMWSATVFTGKTAGEVFRWLSRRHTTTSALLTRFPLGLLFLLPLLLLLLGLCLFGPEGLQSVLPAVNITQWSTAVFDVPGLSTVYKLASSQSQSAESAVQKSTEVQPYVEPLYSQPPPTERARADQEESARLVRLEQSLTDLWERVEAGGQRAEQRHQELLQLYTDLQQQQLFSAPSNSEGMKPWLSALLDQQLSQLRTRLDEEGLQREEARQQDLLQQQSQTSRLDELELQLQALAAKTEKLQWRQEAASTTTASSTTLPAPVSVGVDRQSHDALLVEVARLEEALEEVRRDVGCLSGAQDGCQQLSRIQQTISAQVSSQVREEVRALVHQNQLTLGGGSFSDDAGLPESLLQWLSQQYVSGAELQAALASLELSILHNISLQLEQRQSEEMVREAVLNTAGATMTQEDIHVIVKNALRLFSQDRTGLADYALESGGGSILSTRCSETYETKAALLSLFGVPLWYFSQSPRAVIQPDVHPGNCWAFRGSTGFLVIRLSMMILPTSFSLEHIPKALTPTGNLNSAPRDFSIYGLDDESQDRGTLLGTYTYEEDGEALQSFPVTEDNDQAFQIIEVQVLSNWGHEEYTCMYRFRVHGTPSDA